MKLPIRRQARSCNVIIGCCKTRHFIVCVIQANFIKHKSYRSAKIKCNKVLYNYHVHYPQKH